MADDKLIINVYDDQKKPVRRELLMSFGLLLALSSIVGDVNRLGLIDLVPEMAADTLKAVLSERDAKGVILDPEVAVPDLAPSEANKIFDWVKEALMDFFLRRLLHTAALFDQNKEKLASAVSSMASTRS